MKMAKEQEHPAKVKSEKGKKSRKGLAAGLGGAQFTEREEALFEKLRTLRAEIAKEEKVPPYIVFSDKTLTHMCVVKPVTKEEMLKVTGVGEFKYTKYGERFLACVKKETQTEAGAVTGSEAGAATGLEAGAAAGTAAAVPDYSGYDDSDDLYFFSEEEDLPDY